MSVRKRGRPRKNPTVVSDNDEKEEAAEEVADQGKICLTVFWQYQFISEILF